FPMRFTLRTTLLASLFSFNGHANILRYTLPLHDALPIFRQGLPGAHGRGRPGKLINFLYLLGRHPEEVEADLASEYGGLDLVDLWRGRITARRLSVLTVHLPSGSRVCKATGGAPAWSDEVSTLMILDLRLRELFWAETEDGQKGRNAPEIVSPPPFEDEVEEEGSKLDAKAEKFRLMEERRAARRAAQNNEG